MLKESENTRTKYDTCNLPSRDEFHKYFSGYVYEYDFCTDHPVSRPGAHIQRIADDLRYSRNNYIESKITKNKEKSKKTDKNT